MGEAKRKRRLLMQASVLANTSHLVEDNIQQIYAAKTNPARRVYGRPKRRKGREMKW